MSDYMSKVKNGECPECGDMLFPGEIKEKFCHNCETDLTTETEVFA